MEQFNDYLTTSGKSANTKKAYLSDLKQFSIWLQETYEEDCFAPDAITQKDIVQYKAYKQTTQQRKPASINRSLRSISAFFEWARKQRLITENPVEEVPVAQQVETPPKALDKTKSNRLMRMVEKASNKRDIAIVELMFNAGLRIGEVEALNVDDIKLSDRKGLVRV